MMYTSAQALNELLAQIIRSSKPQERFSTILANYLGLSNDDGEGDALIHLRRLAIRVRDDIEQIDVDDQSKKHLRALFAPFNGIVTLAHTTGTLEQSKSNFLKAENLVNLTNINLALDGKVNRIDMQFECREIANDLRSILESISDLAIPDDIKHLIIRRIMQIIASLDHFRFFGAVGLQETLSNLTSALVIYVGKEIENENIKFFKKLRKVLFGGFQVLEKVRKGTDDVRVVSENLPKISENISVAMDLIGGTGSG